MKKQKNKTNIREIRDKKTALLLSAIFISKY